VSLFFTILLGGVKPVAAAKLDLFFGGFSFSAETDSASGSASGVGAYLINYSLPIFDNLDVGLGYSLILADTFGGDSVFGLDVQAAYYPLTPGSEIKIVSGNTKATVGHIWKPYLSMNYSARQFQSVVTQYNGFGVGVGVERKLEAKYTLKCHLRYSAMAGPDSSTATEITFVSGLSFSF
jgi:hypothetical protein